MSGLASSTASKQHSSSSNIFVGTASTLARAASGKSLGLSAPFIRDL
jgi:hypothetical protein